jgi:hypothetical protein
MNLGFYANDQMEVFFAKAIDLDWFHIFIRIKPGKIVY